MKHDEKITVVTVTYNCCDVVEKTIKSVINQTYNNMEYIIIDGNSDDGTQVIINKYIDYISYFVSEKDRGIYDAMNKAIIAATGDWIIFMNAGDGFVNNLVLERAIVNIDKDTIIANGNIIMLCDGYYYKCNAPGTEDIENRMPVYHQATFTRVEYHKHHLFDISFRSSGDYKFFYEAYKNGCKFQLLPISIAYFDNKQGMSKDNHRLSMYENLRIWRKENDYLFKTKLNFKLFIFSLKQLIKRKLLSRKQARKLEIHRLNNDGFNVFVDNYDA